MTEQTPKQTVGTVNVTMTDFEWYCPSCNHYNGDNLRDIETDIDLDLVICLKCKHHFIIDKKF